jgi:FkbM family methyltransferase
MENRTVVDEVFNPEMDILNTLAHILQNKKAIDVGANRGDFTAALRHVGFQVDSFEPLASMTEILEERFKTDALVSIHEVACSNIDGVGRLYEFTSSDTNLDDTLFSTLRPHPSYEGLNLDQNSLVQLSRLDTILGEQLNAQFGLLKIDTEGHDIAVLEGASKIKFEALLVEFWDEQFIFNQGQVANRLSDYESSIDRLEFPFSILFWRGSDNLAFGFVCNVKETPPMSWGNILYLRSSDAFEAVKEFCLVKYGLARMAEVRATLPSATPQVTELNEPEVQINDGVAE